MISRIVLIVAALGHPLFSFILQAYAIRAVDCPDCTTKGQSTALNHIMREVLTELSPDREVSLHAACAQT